MGRLTVDWRVNGCRPLGSPMTVMPRGAKVWLVSQMGLFHVEEVARTWMAWQWFCSSPSLTSAKPLPNRLSYLKLVSHTLATLLPLFRALCSWTSENVLWHAWMAAYMRWHLEPYLCEWKLLLTCTRSYTISPRVKFSGCLEARVAAEENGQGKTWLPRKHLTRTAVWMPSCTVVRIIVTASLAFYVNTDGQRLLLTHLASNRFCQMLTWRKKLEMAVWQKGQSTTPTHPFFCWQKTFVTVSSCISTWEEGIFVGDFEVKKVLSLVSLSLCFLDFSVLTASPCIELPMKVWFFLNRQHSIDLAGCWIFSADWVQTESWWSSFLCACLCQIFLLCKLFLVWSLAVWPLFCFSR